VEAEENKLRGCCVDLDLVGMDGGEEIDEGRQLEVLKR